MVTSLSVSPGRKSALGSNYFRNGSQNSSLWRKMVWILVSKTPFFGGCFGVALVHSYYKEHMKVPRDYKNCWQIFCFYIQYCIGIYFILVDNRSFHNSLICILLLVRIKKFFPACNLRDILRIVKIQKVSLTLRYILKYLCLKLHKSLIRTSNKKRIKNICVCSFCIFILRSWHHLNDFSALAIWHHRNVTLMHFHYQASTTWLYYSAAVVREGKGGKNGGEGGQLGGIIATFPSYSDTHSSLCQFL